MEDINIENSEISVSRTGNSIRISNVSEELLSEVIEPLISNKNALSKSP